MDILYPIRRSLAKRRLKRKVQQWKDFCIKNRIRHSNENIAVSRYMLAEILMLRQQFLPWGKYFRMGPYGCGDMDSVLKYDLNGIDVFYKLKEYMWRRRFK